jgi:hypothetical protein
MNISPHLALASWGFILLLVMAAKRCVRQCRHDRADPTRWLRIAALERPYAGS